MNILIDQGIAKGLIAFDAEQKIITYKIQNKRKRRSGPMPTSPWCSNTAIPLSRSTLRSQSSIAFQTSMQKLKENDLLVKNTGVGSIPVIFNEEILKAVEVAYQQYALALAQASQKLENTKHHIEAMLLGEET